MEISLAVLLARGELTAFGLRMGAPLNEGAVQIPAYFFPSTCQSDAEINWDASTLSSAGHKFVQIRVCQDQRVDDTHFSSMDVQPERRSRGRPVVLDKVLEIVADLDRQGKLGPMARKPMFQLIRAETRRKYPKAFPTSSQPSDPIIRKALERAGLLSD